MWNDRIYRLVQKVSSHVLWKIGTRNIVQRTMTLQSPSKQAPWDLRQFSQSPSIAWSYFPKSHQWSEVSYFSKVTLVLGKARSHRTPYLGCRGSESPGWFDVSPENSTQDMMHKRECCHDEAPNSQLPIAVAFWIIWIVLQEMSKLNVKFDAYSLLY